MKMMVHLGIGKVAHQQAIARNIARIFLLGLGNLDVARCRLSGNLSFVWDAINHLIFSFDLIDSHRT